MKEYLVSKEESLFIDTNINYVIDNNVNNILVKSGVTTNLLTYNVTEGLNFKIDVEKDAVVNLYQIVQTDNLTNINENIYLLEQGATVNNIIVLLGTKEAKLNSNISIYHNVGNTFSDLKTYTIVKDYANIKLGNNAYIKNRAAGSVARQSSKGLSLSKNGTILIDPNLFINEYDVMASHGVAMGSLNKDDLFYLMSRGLTKEEASQIVIMGFIMPLLEAVDNKNYSEEISKRFKENLQ